MKEKFNFNRSYLEIFCLFVFLFIASFVFLVNSPLHIWIGSDIGTDSGVFSTVAMMMDKGYMPYRDTFDHKGPLLYLINYLGRHISVYRGVWTIEFVSMYTTFLFVYKIARLKCGKIISCIVLLLSTSMLFVFFEGGNLTEEYAMPFIAGALYIFLDYFINLKISIIRLIFCGLCFGAVCLLRPNMISLWIVFCIAVLIKCIENRNFQDLKKFILFFLAGFFFIVFPIILWLSLNNCLVDFWDEYIRFNFIYISSSDYTRWNSFFYFFNWPVELLAVVISVYLFCNSKMRFLYGIYCCYLFCTLFFICLSGDIYGHYGMILVPAVAFPIASLFDICMKSFPANEGKTVSFLIVVYFLYTLIIPSWVPTISKLSEIYSLRNEEHNSVLANEVSGIVSENSQNDDKISVYGNWNIIYVLSDRQHATKYSYQFPIGEINPNIMQDYFNELKEQLPPIIVVQRHYDDRIKEFLDDNDYSLLWSGTNDGKKNILIFSR